MYIFMVKLRFNEVLYKLCNGLALYLPRYLLNGIFTKIVPYNVNILKRKREGGGGGGGPKCRGAVR